MRQVTAYEKVLFEVVKENHCGFYYQKIIKTIEKDGFKIKIDKKKQEMIGNIEVTLKNGEIIGYEMLYNRITNLSEGYTLLVN